MSVYDGSGNAISDVYNVNGQRLNQCYDIDKNTLFPVYTLITNQDSATGTSSGKTLTEQEGENGYVLRMLADFNNPYAVSQYLGYNPTAKRYYRFSGSTSVSVYNSNMELIETVTLPSSAGHNNDGCCINGIFYLAGGYFGVSLANATKLYVWDIANNTLETITVSGIVQPSNGSLRMVAAVCETERGSGQLLLICNDNTSSELVHAEGDKLAVYEYSLGTGATKLLAEYPWDCVYVQGATAYKGILYVACNTQTTVSASSYKGITIKAIRMDTLEMIDTLICAGAFEPEGMDVVPADGSMEISIGMNKSGIISQTVRFTPPYELEEATV